jgi:hypothetical protein
MAKKKKKSIKINFKYFWEDFDPENNFYTNLLRKEYNVIISDNPDYLFYSIYSEVKEKKDLSKKGDFLKKISPYLYFLMRKLYVRFKNLRNPNRPKVPQGNFVKILHAAEHATPNMSECDWAFGSHFEKEIKHPRYMRAPAYMLSDYMLKDFGSPNLKRKIDFKKIKKEKKKFCNFIYSQENMARNNFFKALSRYKHVDSPGRCMNNMPPIGSHLTPKESRSSFIWSKEKLKFLKPYKFTIAFENLSSPGWVTEKITHAFLTNSVPIYFGHKTVSRDFNSKSFLDYHYFNNMKKFIEHIARVDQDDNLYQEYLKQSIYPNKKAYEFSRTDRIEKRLKEIIESKK